MNLSDIITKCYILALIIRDDGERLLLGDGIYEFKSSLQHFAPNIYQNDVVELQGTDGQLLAGQVRRSATQAFDGYIADGTIGKTDTEQSRRRFLGFFRKKHHYKVVYIMPDGTAVQRDRGYIVDAPAVQELYQRFPEYHIGLNFEDPNYYEYSENDEGEEIYTHIQAIALFRELEAGLVWDAFGAVSDDIAWTEYMTKNSTDGYILIGNGLPVEAPLSLTHLYGNTEQKTLSGKNLLQLDDTSQTNQNISYYREPAIQHRPILEAGTTYTLSADITIGGSETECMVSVGAGQNTYSTDVFTVSHQTSGKLVMTFAPTAAQLANGANFFLRFPRFSEPKTGINYSIANVMLEKSSTATPYEPYVGSTPAPNPDFPQVVNTVSGEQTVKITGKNLFADTSDGFTKPLDYYIRPIQLEQGKKYQFYQQLKSGKTALSNIVVGIVPYGEKYSDFSGVMQTIINYNGTTTDRVLIPNSTWTSPKVIVYASNLTQIGEIMDTYDIMLEQSDTKTQYEPYQGQSQEINLGKNLLPITATSTTKNGTTFTFNPDGTITVSGTPSTQTDVGISGVFSLTATGPMTLSNDGTMPNGSALVFKRTAGGTTTYPEALTPGSNTYAIAEGTVFETPLIRIKTTFTGTTTFKFQLEAGTQASPYAPYKTPLELAKIGTYQDYIWNDNGTWKIHKETSKVVLTGAQDETWSWNGPSNARFTHVIDDIKVAPNDTTLVPMFCSHFIAMPIRDIYQGADYGIGSHNSLHQIWVSFHAYTSVGDFKSWLSAHNTTLYYPLATPTDTEITDSELIEQLNHIYSLYGGVNNLWLIPSAGAQGEMTVRFGVAYDDDGSGYHWSEELGSPDNIISNDGIDSVRPIWIINGPATNPTLTNITTAQTIAWNGTVPADSTLTVDMERQTATLNGANVYAQIEGDWLELAVGPNKLQYTASGGATADSTLEWNGVAG